MPSIRAPASKQTATLQVAVKCRPLTDNEQRRSRHIIQVIDDKSVVVLDPDLSKDYLDLIQNWTKEKRYTFDHVYAPGCSNSECPVLWTFPNDTAMRWEKVAAAVPGKMKAACMRRVTELKGDFRSSKTSSEAAS